MTSQWSTNRVKSYLVSCSTSLTTIRQGYQISIMSSQPFSIRPLNNIRKTIDKLFIILTSLSFHEHFNLLSGNNITLIYMMYITGIIKIILEYKTLSYSPSTKNIVQYSKNQQIYQTFCSSKHSLYALVYKLLID